MLNPSGLIGESSGKWGTEKGRWASHPSYFEDTTSMWRFFYTRYIALLFILELKYPLLSVIYPPSMKGHHNVVVVIARKKYYPTP